MISKVLRRIHMYAALFLVPWVLMYAISTMVMNHHHHFDGPPPKPEFTQVWTGTYGGVIDPKVDARLTAMQLLEDRDLQGRFDVKRHTDDRRTVVTRRTPSALYQLTHNPKDNSLVVEKATMGSRLLLAQLHRRSGFRSEYTQEDAWGLSVDTFIAVMLFWIVSGIWMWWLLRTTRPLGWLSMLAGVALFAVFLVAL